MRPVTAFHFLTTVGNQKAFHDILKLLPAALHSLAQVTLGCRRCTWAGVHCFSKNLTRKTKFYSLLRILRLLQGLSATCSEPKNSFCAPMCEQVCLLTTTKKSCSFDIIVPNTSSWHYSINTSSSLENMYHIKKLHSGCCAQAAICLWELAGTSSSSHQIVRIQEKEERVHIKFD